MSYERTNRFYWIAAALVAASIALAACAPGGASESNGGPDDGRPSANQPAATKFAMELELHCKHFSRSALQHFSFLLLKC